jgi:hypothetical protein
VLVQAGVVDFTTYLDGGRERDLAIDMWVEPRPSDDPAHRLY